MCASSTCVEIAFTADSVLIRDSKYAKRADGSSSPVLDVPKGRWSRFSDYLLCGKGLETSFTVTVDLHAMGARLTQGGVTLDFDQSEWSAFLSGLKVGEFSVEANA